MLKKHSENFFENRKTALKELAAEFEHIRRQQNLTLEALESISTFGVQTIIGFERGRRLYELKLDALFEYADYLGKFPRIILEDYPATAEEA